MNPREYELGWEIYLRPHAAVGRQRGVWTRDSVREQLPREIGELGGSLLGRIREIARPELQGLTRGRR